MTARATVKAEEMSDLGDNRESWVSGTTGRRRGERHRAVISTNNVCQKHKNSRTTVSISCTVAYFTADIENSTPWKFSSLSVQLTHPLKCSWTNLKSCRPNSMLSSPYWEPIATALRSRWEAALFQSPAGTAEKKQSSKRTETSWQGRAKGQHDLFDTPWGVWEFWFLGFSYISEETCGQSSLCLVSASEHQYPIWYIGMN